MINSISLTHKLHTNFSIFCFEIRSEEEHKDGATKRNSGLIDDLNGHIRALEFRFHSQGTHGSMVEGLGFRVLGLAVQESGTRGKACCKIRKQRSLGFRC